MKLVIFDIDGTLCYSKFVDDLCFINAFRIALDYELTAEQAEWDKYKTATELGVVKEILTGLQRNADKSSINKVIDAYTAELEIQLNKNSNSFTVVHGAKELIDYLVKNMDCEPAIATGGFLKPALLKLSKLGFDIAGIELRSSDDFGSKQEMIKDIIRTHSKRTGNISIEKVVYIGDREYDYKTSMALGIDFVGIDFNGNGKLQKAGVKNVINNFEPIEKFLELI